MISSQGHGAATDVGSKTLDAGGSRDANLLHFRVGDDHPTYVKLLMGHVTALRVQFGRVLLLDFHASPGHVFFPFFFPRQSRGRTCLVISRRSLKPARRPRRLLEAAECAAFVETGIRTPDTPPLRVQWFFFFLYWGRGSTPPKVPQKWYRSYVVDVACVHLSKYPVTGVVSVLERVWSMGALAKDAGLRGSLAPLVATP
ncbi:hypothetical protein M0657_007858 [Pyricularia oryzae]|nr:hypothetical protein M9X92_007617 [Pyricularia oryzae]KAI7917856.1 hypothetical protein M0657_007858 [Pyricularia oryzae]